MMPRQIIPRPTMQGRPPMQQTRPMPARPQGKPSTKEKPQKDKEFEDTMKKLRDMSK
jgi:hypothetical protein